MHLEIFKIKDGKIAALQLCFVSEKKAGSVSAYNGRAWTSQRERERGAQSLPTVNWSSPQNINHGETTHCSINSSSSQYFTSFWTKNTIQYNRIKMSVVLGKLCMNHNIYHTFTRLPKSFSEVSESVQLGNGIYLELPGFVFGKPVATAAKHLNSFRRFWEKNWLS